MNVAALQASSAHSSSHVADVLSVKPASGKPLSGKALRNAPVAEQRKEVSAQFEAILVRQLLGPTMTSMLGKEGVVGLPVILKNRIIPYDVKVRLRSDALKIKAEVFQEEFDKGQVLHEFVLRYLSVMITQISQSSICNRFHTIEATLSRWLLTVQDQTNSNTLYLTQQIISQALGVPRTGVTVAAGALQTDGAIRYSRGKIAILDRMRLESHSCECYRLIRAELDQFLNN